MNYIKVYRFEDAPKELQDLSTNGGDEDWIAIVPHNMKDDDILWLEAGTPFGCCCVDEYWLENGNKIYIGSHA